MPMRRGVRSETSNVKSACGIDGKAWGRCMTLTFTYLGGLARLVTGNLQRLRGL